MSVKFLIIDDEPKARELLVSYCNELFSDAVVSEAKNAIEGLSALRNTEFDIVLLDINMPKMSGIEFLKTLSIESAVILTTAYSKYAVESYELDVADYLLKPIAFPRFVSAVYKALDKVQKSDLSEVKSETAIKDHIFIYANKQNIRIDFDHLLFIEGFGNYLKLILNSGASHLVKEPLKTFLKKLPERVFLQCHRSFIVNMSKVDKKQGNRLFVGSNQIPISQSFKLKIEKFINSNNI